VSPEKIMAASLAKKVKPVCNHCGSEDIRIEAFVEWNAAKQAWNVREVTDNIVCNECGKDCKPKWILV
jgi:hypothetical protein